MTTFQREQLATRLNVLQCQIDRELRHNMTLRMPVTDTLRAWARDLREIELALRGLPK